MPRNQAAFLSLGAVLGDGYFAVVSRGKTLKKSPLFAALQHRSRAVDCESPDDCNSLCLLCRAMLPGSPRYSNGRLEACPTACQDVAIYEVWRTGSLPYGKSALFRMTLELLHPEYRKDPLSEGWVVIAADRGGRPDEFQQVQPQSRIAGPCPFCAGNEAFTPDEIRRYHASNGEWKVRVVPNKFPAVVRCAGIDQALVTKTFKNGTPSLYTSLQGHGGHEVVIESREHAVSLTDLDQASRDFTFLAYRDRLQALANEESFAYVQIFKNVGAAAGSSIEHAHSQVVGLPTVPIRVAEELAHTATYLKKHGRQLFEVMLEEELSLGTRVVAESPEFVAFCPYASRFPYETWILPRKHLPRFETSSDALATACGEFTAEILGRLERVLNRPAYNYVLHSAPVNGSADRHYRWHFEILPRIVKAAGFEWGTGYYINPVSPEQAALALRLA